MKITGKEGGPIDRAQAKKWTARYRSSGRGKTNSHLFGADTVKTAGAGGMCRNADLLCFGRYWRAAVIVDCD